MKIKVSKLDAIFSRYIRYLSGGFCKRCKKYKGAERLQVHHFHGRRKQSVRYDMENVMALCFTCHRHFHENPLEMVEAWLEWLGQTKFDALTLRANTPQKIDKEELLKYYQDKIAQL